MNTWIGAFRVCLGFLTIIPAGKQVQWTPPLAARSIVFFPLIGGFIGIGAGGLFFLLQHILSLPDTITAFLIILYFTMMSGGLHLDGWMDCADAAGSWGDKQKKLRVMKDPQSGAFAVWTTIFLLGGRFVCIYEALSLSSSFLWVLLFLLPVLSRTMMAIHLAYMPLAKTTGLAAWFRQEFQFPYSLCFWLMSGVLIFAAALLASWSVFVFIISVSACGFVFMSAWLCYRLFGGATGDTVGAVCEGGETWLWLTVALFGLSVMG